MGTSSFKISLGLFCVFGALAALLSFASPEDIAAFTMAVLCGGIGFGALWFLRDTARRAIAWKLFGAAYFLRLVTTLIFYKSGAAEMMGGGDEIIWEQAWQQSLFWVHGVINPYLSDEFIRRQTANSIIELYDGTVIPNTGYRFFVTYFFYIINIPSQMALAVVNCFFNALTVVVIYQFAREFFSHRASQFAAIIALILPGYLVWSAMTIKETWLIFIEVVAFFALWRVTRFGLGPKAWPYGLLILFLIIVTHSLRFYVAWLLAPVVVMSYFALRSPRPMRTLVLYVGGVLALSVVLGQIGLASFDLLGLAKKALFAMSDLRETISTKETGRDSAVVLSYDITTPVGFALMFLTGVAYLLFAPFPWQVLTDASMRQLLVLPESLLWYGLIAVFIGPGLIECWCYHRQLLTGIFLFVMPLILLYSLSFANIGLVYRQRSQLMPFFLLVVAAGHESLSRRKRERALRAGQQHGQSYGYRYGYGYGYRYRYGRSAYGNSYRSASPVATMSEMNP